MLHLINFNISLELVQHIYSVFFYLPVLYTCMSTVAAVWPPVKHFSGLWMTGGKMELGEGNRAENEKSIWSCR